MLLRLFYLLLRALGMRVLATWINAIIEGFLFGNVKMDGNFRVILIL